MIIMGSCLRFYILSQFIVLSLLHWANSTVYLSDHCGKTITLHGDRIRSHKGELYPRDLDCRVLLKTPQHHYKIKLKFEWFELPPALPLPEDLENPEDRATCKDYLEVYDSVELHYSHRKCRQCGDEETPTLSSTGDVMLLRFVTDGEQTEKDIGFLITFTSYTSFSTSEMADFCLNVNDFYCENEFCIDKSLSCDCKRNCEDGTDEIYCATCKADVIYSSGLSAGSIVGIVFGVILVIAVVVVVIYIMYRKHIFKTKSINQQPILHRKQGASVAPETTGHHVTSTSHGSAPWAQP